jgi:hypothetical protein
MLLLVIISVANPLLPFVKFRVRPWLIFCLFFLLWLLLISVKFRVNPWLILLLSYSTVNLKWGQWVKYYVFR